MIRTLLAVNDNRLADHLAGLAAESDELEIVSILRDPQELRGALPRTDVDAVVLHDRRGSLPLIEVTRELTAAHPDLGLVLVVSENSPEVLRAGMQAGARDVLAEPIGLEQLETSALAAASWTQALRRRAARDAEGELHGIGRVVAVVGAKGGVGTTTVAVQLALAARKLGEESVCLVEYDLQAGDLRAFLDLPYRRSVADLATVADELSTRHLQETLYTHSTGMRVLLAPQEGEQADMVSAAAARNILTAIRTREALTIVDAGSTVTEASAIAAEMADTVLIVTTPDVVSLRGVSRLCSLWDRLNVEPPEVAVLLNRTSRKLEVSPDLARRVVPVPMLQTTVPSDFFSLEPAINAGVPTAGGAGEMMLRPMAGVLGEISAMRPQAAEEPEPSTAKRLAARFAGESGQATVEFAGLLPLLALVLFALWQIVLVGITFVSAGHAARAGARALAVGSSVQPAAVKDLPSAWRAGATVKQSFGQPCDGSGSGSADAIDGCVKVSIDTPLLLPGLFDHVLPSITSSAGTVLEGAPVQADSGFTMTNVAFGTGTDPIPGYTIGRDDMGVDACATPGAPIYAPSASVLVDVVNNWYNGQPLLLFRFVNPPAGALSPYWYVAEQITPLSTAPNTVYAAHQPVATFAPSGTCIEIGWGSPTSRSRTLASQSGDSGAANPAAGATTPWGETFKRFFGIQ